MARRDFPNRSNQGRSELDRTPPRRGREPKERSFLGRWLRRLFVWVTSLVLLGALALVVAVVASIAGCAYVMTSSALWSFMVVIVGVPIVALPAFLIVGIAREMLAGRARPD